MEFKYIHNSVKKDIKILLREYTVIFILIVFIAMSITSTYIGWSSQHIVQNVYDETAKQLIQENKQVPPSPFNSIPQLALLKNMIIYIVLIGSLLAIILGHTIIVNDKKNGISKILFSKPFSRKEYLLGKIVTASIILCIILLIAMIINIIFVSLLSIITINSLLAIGIFYFISFLFLSGFVFLGIFFGILTDNSTKAILLPMILWIIIIFVLPELGSALYPTSSLNPVLPDTKILDSSILTTMHSVIYPLSVSEQYKAFSGANFRLTTDTTTNITKYSSRIQIIILLIWVMITIGLSYYAIKKFDPSRGDQYE